MGESMPALSSFFTLCSGKMCAKRNINEKEVGLESNEQTTKRPMRCVAYILICIMLVCISALITCLAIFLSRTSHPKKYALIIECGPNTSKFHLFEYTVEYGRAKSPLRQCGHTKVGPGISSFGKNATASAEAIMREANAIITKGVPSASRNDTRIFLGAETDFRLIERVNAKEAEALMSVMRKTVADPALEGVVESPKDDVRILSDADEGFFQWLAVNYGMGDFRKEDSEEPRNSQSMLGVVELGNASTQIAFAPQTEEPIVKDELLRMALGHNHHLYSQSNLCYGVTTIRARYLARLTEGSDVNSTVMSPCHQRGLTMEVASDDIFQTPCVTSAGEDVMGPSISRPSVAAGKIKFKGDYNASTCGRAIEAIFTNGTFSQVQRPRLQGDFAAVNKLAEIVTSYTKANQTVKVTRTEFAATIDKFCKRNWTSLSPEERDTAEEKCLEGWIVKELMEAYGFKSDTDWKRVTFVGGMDESAVGWSTGYALRKKGPNIEVKPEISLISVEGYVGIGLAAALLLGCLIEGIIKCVAYLTSSENFPEDSFGEDSSIYSISTSIRVFQYSY